jgi:hypothetical protein
VCVCAWDSMMLLSHVVLKSSHLVPLSKVTNKPELLVESGRGGDRREEGREGGGGRDRGREADSSVRILFLPQGKLTLQLSMIDMTKRYVKGRNRVENKPSNKSKR